MIQILLLPSKLRGRGPHSRSAEDDLQAWLEKLKAFFKSKRISARKCHHITSWTGLQMSAKVPIGAPEGP